MNPARKLSHALKALARLWRPREVAPDRPDSEDRQPARLQSIYEQRGDSFERVTEFYTRRD